MAPTKSRIEKGAELAVPGPLVARLARQVIEAALDVLEGDPALAARVSKVLGHSPPTTESRGRKYMTVDEYAEHARVSSRTIRGYVACGMLEGEHFHREGRTGRRVIIHVTSADSWRASRRFAKNEEHALHDLATNEILRRRAHAALKKTGAR